MKNKAARRKPGSNLRSLFYLAGWEFVAAGVLTAAVAARQHFVTTLVIAVAIALAGAAGLVLTRWLDQSARLAQSGTAALTSARGQLLPSAAILALSGFLFLSGPSAQVTLMLAPIIAAVWLIGAELLILFPPQQIPATQSPAAAAATPWLAWPSLLLAYAIALVPARIPAVLDGIPWDSPVEFVLVMLLLPLAFVAGRKYFANRIVATILGFFLIVKIALMLLLPQSGLGIRAYSSEQDLSSGRWERSYFSWMHPAYSQVVQTPYYSYRELPIEWVNNPHFDPDEFWVALELVGYARLEADEKLVFIVEGARQAQVELVDAATHSAIPAVLAERTEDLDASLYQAAPDLKEFEIRGSLIFKKFGQYRIEPVVLQPDGSARSAFETARIWTDPAGLRYPAAQLRTYQDLAELIGLALIGIVLVILLRGLRDLYRSGQLAPVDVYLACSGSLAFFIAGLVSKPDMNLLLINVLIVLACVKVIDLAVFRRDPSGRALLFSIGTAFLLIFLRLELDTLRSIFLFPQSQDGLEYQIFARRIFVNGDVFLAQTPPRAYKVLFPYVVGGLHSLFGQSASAQFFLNAWFGLLSCITMTRLVKSMMPAALSFLVSIYFLIAVCLPSIYVYYFRFGLIEPVAILLLLTTFHLALQRRLPAMFAAGMLTVLFRLDYLGAACAAVLLTSQPITGTAGRAWPQLLEWLRVHWRLAAGYAASLCTPSLLIILGYFMFTSDYVLNASDTHQTSPASVLESLVRVIVGGNPSELRARLVENPADLLLIGVPLALGFLIALAAILYRQGLFQKMDLRLALLIPCLLPAYIVVRPAAYFPRFSLPLLAMDLMLIGLFVSHLAAQRLGRRT